MMNPINPVGNSPHFQLISDEDSLEDHLSGLEDFQGVTLQINDNDMTPASPASTVGKIYDPEDKSSLSLFMQKDLKGSASNGALPRIAITPMTPPSASLSPDGHSTVSLNSSVGTPTMHKYRGQMTSTNCYWRPQSPMPPKSEFEAKEFFAYRDTIVQNVIDEVQNLADENLDGSVRGTWLLTEIDHWDNEKERIVVLCDKTMIIVKYDFIAVKTVENRRIDLGIIDKIIQGELKYPDRSLAPRLSGIAGGIVGVVKDCIIPRVHDTVQTVGSAVLYKNKCTNSNSDTFDNEKTGNLDSQSQNSQGDLNSPKTSIMSALSLENFEPRSRNTSGMRIMWNQEQPLSFTQKWNPFDKSIPWLTFSSHPLLWHKGGGGGINRSFDIDSFSRELIDILSSGGGGGGDSSPMCRVEYKPIIIETYLGLASLFHNANSLGFYKVRGKVSF